MSTSPTYKKIRDLNSKESPDSTDEVAVADKDTLSTNRISINNLVKAAFSHDNSVFETDANGNLTLKLGAIDGSKISPGTIKSEQLAPGSITGDAIAPEAIQQHLVTNKTSKPVLADSTGVVRTISNSYYGVISLLVNNRADGLAHSNDHIDGPNTREFAGTLISSQIITIMDHGLFNDSKITISSMAGSSFPESSPIIDGQDLHVKIIDKDNFSVSLTSGSLAINLGPGWEGQFTLRRDTIVSKDISAWVSDSYSPIYASTVNYNFSTVEAAYSWCARNADLTFVNILIGHHSNPVTYWNSPGASSRLSLDPEFVKPKLLCIFGNLDNGTNRQRGWDGAGNAEQKTNYHPYNRARLHVYSGATRTLPLWFRGQSELKIENLWWLFDYEDNTSVNQFMNIGKAIIHWSNSSCEAINRAGGALKALNIGENGFLYMMQFGANYFGGLSSHGFLHVEGFSSGGVGMPGDSAYVVTEVNGTYAKRRYVTSVAAALRSGRTLDNSTGSWSAAGTDMEYTNTNVAI